MQIAKHRNVCNKIVFCISFSSTYLILGFKLNIAATLTTLMPWHSQQRWPPILCKHNVLQGGRLFIYCDSFFIFYIFLHNNPMSYKTHFHSYPSTNNITPNVKWMVMSMWWSSKHFNLIEYCHLLAITISNLYIKIFSKNYPEVWFHNILLAAIKIITESWFWTLDSRVWCERLPHSWGHVNFSNNQSIVMYNKFNWQMTDWAAVI